MIVCAAVDKETYFFVGSLWNLKKASRNLCGIFTKTKSDGAEFTVELETLSTSDG